MQPEWVNCIEIKIPTVIGRSASNNTLNVVDRFLQNPRRYYEEITNMLPKLDFNNLEYTVDNQPNKIVDILTIKNGNSDESVFEGILITSERREIPVVIKKGNVDKYKLTLEFMMHILLWCMRKKILLQFPNDIFWYPIPEVFLYTKLKGFFEKQIIVMEKFHDTLSNAMSYVSKNEFLSLIIQTVYIYWLFSKIGFSHNDFHMGNIMVNRSDGFELEISNTEIQCLHQIYLIDFGYSCLDLSKCENCNIQYGLGGVCNSFEHDIRIFFNALVTKFSDEDDIDYDITDSEDKIEIMNLFSDKISDEENFQYHNIMPELLELYRTMNPVTTKRKTFLGSSTLSNRPRKKGKLGF